MDLKLALRLVELHYNHAKIRHPEAKTLNRWEDLMSARMVDLSNAVGQDKITDHLQIAGKRALQLAAMALRMFDDLDLELVGPTYPAGILVHEEP